MRTTASRHRGVTGRAVLTLALLVPALLLTLPSPARAAPTLQVTPTTVPADVPATIQIQGTECPYADVRVGLWDPLVRGAADEYIDRAFPTPAPDGSWSATLQATMAAGQYLLSVLCLDPSGGGSDVYPGNVVIVAVPPSGIAVRPSATPVYLDNLDMWERVQVVGGGCTPTTAGDATVEGLARTTGPEPREISRTQFTAIARPDGSWYATLPVGPDMAPGLYTVEASCRHEPGGSTSLVGTTPLTILDGRYPSIRVTPSSAPADGPVRFSVSGDLCLARTEYSPVGGESAEVEVGVWKNFPPPVWTGTPVPLATAVVPVPASAPMGAWTVVLEPPPGTPVEPGPYDIEARCTGGAQQPFGYEMLFVEITPATPAAPVQPAFTG